MASEGKFKLGDRGGIFFHFPISLLFTERECMYVREE